MTENEISFAIRGAVFTVYNHLGPGLLESVYENVLKHELTLIGLTVENQIPLPVYYKEVKLDLGFRIDLLVNGTVIIEIKSVEHLAEVHHKQLLSYLKLSNKKLGLLINFNTTEIDKNIFRKVNKL
ncbi:MAG: GxxExxY protein [Bacteroidota bacterium]